MMLKGDCIEVMKAMKPNSVDAICTDPPYGLEFMGKEWDKLTRNLMRPDSEADKERKKKYGRNYAGRKSNLPDILGSQKHAPEMQLWHTQWLTEAYRVLKPGGSMLVMGGTRTFHRLACAIEDSGFIIKDTLMWLYGSGFPKAQDLGKMIDKRGGKDIAWFIDYILKVAKERNISKKELTNLFLSKNGKPTGWLYNKSSHTQGLTVEQFNKIKDFLNLPFDNLEEAKREIIKKKRIQRNSASWESKKGMLAIEEQNFDTTAPSTDLAKHWDGFKVGGIKPAYEPIIWAVKPPEGSYFDNVLKWGVGAINVDECRIDSVIKNNEKRTSKPGGGKGGMFIHDGDMPAGERHNSKGRFPANIILSHHPECVQVGMKKVRQAWSDKGILSVDGFNPGQPCKEKPGRKVKKHCDSDGYETVESWDCHPDCAVRLLDEQSGVLKSGAIKPNHKSKGWASCNHNGYKRPWMKKAENIGWDVKGDTGGASRFFYCAKASRSERNAGLEGMEEKDKSEHRFGRYRCKKCGKLQLDYNPCKCKNPDFERIEVNKNNHPTVKPIKLFEWLIKLVTREGQIILDPFIGSGTTGIAAHNTGRKCMGIEKEDEYMEIAKRRTAYWRSRPRQLEMRGG